ATRSGRHDDADGPSVIAVDGPWGTGKTSLMRILKGKLDDLSPPRSALQRLADWLARRCSALRGGLRSSSLPFRMRISDVLPVPQGPSTAMTDGPSASSCRPERVA